jgi:hypothetical protein
MATNTDDLSPAAKAAVFGVAMPFILVGVILVYLPLGLLRAWAVWLLYTWFAEPLGAPDLNVWHVWGLLLLYALLTLNTFKKRDTEGFWKGIAGQVIGCLAMVLVGYLIKGWI